MRRVSSGALALLLAVPCRAASGSSAPREVAGLPPARQLLMFDVGHSPDAANAAAGGLGNSSAAPYIDLAAPERDPASVAGQPESASAPRRQEFRQATLFPDLEPATQPPSPPPGLSAGDPLIAARLTPLATAPDPAGADLGAAPAEKPHSALETLSRTAANPLVTNQVFDGDLDPPPPESDAAFAERLHTDALFRQMVAQGRLPSLAPDQPALDADAAAVPENAPGAELFAEREKGGLGQRDDAERFDEWLEPEAYHHGPPKVRPRSVKARSSKGKAEPNPKKEKPPRWKDEYLMRKFGELYEASRDVHDSEVQRSILFKIYGKRKGPNREKKPLWVNDKQVFRIFQALLEDYKKYLASLPQ